MYIYVWLRASIYRIQICRSTLKYYVAAITTDTSAERIVVTFYTIRWNWNYFNGSLLGIFDIYPSKTDVIILTISIYFLKLLRYDEHG